MTQAPLQLLDYWVNFIQVRANTEFDPEQPPQLASIAIDLAADVQPLSVEDPEKNGTVWLVTLRIEQPPIKGKNIPYTFVLEMQGQVAAHPSLEGEELQRAIQVNGPSMLFGSAREILRAATGRGPFAPIIIPSTNFFQRLPAPPVAEPTPELPSQQD
jgi:preprotein translocase subunit SecB